MDGFIQVVAALLMGIASVEFFCAAWLGLLGIIAAVCMVLRKEVGKSRFLGLLNRHVCRLLLFSGLLFICFKLYLDNIGFGKTGFEQMVYFVAVIMGMGKMIPTLPRRINALFSEGEKREEG